MAFMSLKDIDVSYDKKKQILKGLNLDVEKGELQYPVYGLQRP